MFPMPCTYVLLWVRVETANDKKIAGNLSQISLRHASRIFPKKQIAPFIIFTMDVMVEKLFNTFFMIRGAMGCSDIQIKFTAGFDSTFVFKPWQLI